MKAIVLDTQQELFETSVLEQSCPVEFLPYAEVLKRADNSGFVIGQKGLDDYAAVLPALCRAFYQRGAALILVNPPVEIDLGVCIEAPVSVYIKKRKASSMCQRYSPDMPSSGAIAEIWSDAVIETSLSAGIEYVDDEGSCLLLRYQPKNTSGAVFITTLKLLSYSAMTTETDREALLHDLLAWNNAEIHSLPETPAEDVAPIETHILTAVAIIAFALNAIDPSQIAAMIPQFFDFQVDETVVRTALEQLAPGSVPPEAAPEILEDYIHQAGLYAYARELKELFQEQEAPLWKV